MAPFEKVCAVENPPLKCSWSHAFEVGAAVNRSVLTQSLTENLVHHHFSSITAENAMKAERIHPAPSAWNWDEADFIADYARKNNLYMRGHTLLWHNMTPEWFYNGTKKEIQANLEHHIETLVNRYSDVVRCWDVVNEVIDADSGFGGLKPDSYMRRSKWHQLCGAEIYTAAFEAAHRAAPDALLFYNDYNNESGAKLQCTVDFLSRLLDKGVPVHGIGLQGHWYYNYPDESTIRSAIEQYTALGLEIHITELDISMYSWQEKQCLFDTPPEDRLAQQAEQFCTIFRIAADYPSVKNITMWGVADSCTWLDNFPVPNRKNWPLLFDVNGIEKQGMKRLIRTGQYLSD